MRVTQMSAFDVPQKQTDRNKTYVQPQLPRQIKHGLNLKNLISEFSTDDYILAGIILVLIFEGCDDYILLATLGYLFIMGIT
ncbi:MAG: hypothetical protein E7392_02270 [Ruminococcaceae bacterium]|nr:hypothetical protein [Oscillospiraceae bacterium]